MLKVNNQKVIFVDFFDTIMFRKIHSFQVYKRWALLLSRYLEEEITAKEIITLRNNAMFNFTKNKEELNWKTLYTTIYDSLDCKIQNKYEKNTFISICHRLEVDVEIGVQYPHINLLNKLHNYKTKKGCSIYIVSDFHLDKNDLATFLKAKHIDLSLFDDIFVSSDYGCSKLNGNLYKSILEKLNIKPKYILMIGDNPISDGKMANENGIKSKIEYNYKNKCLYQVRRFLNYDYSKYAFRSIENTCRKYNSPYTEYAMLFNVFSKNLRKCLLKKGSEFVTFLSREGYYLKRSFDEIMTILPSCSLSSNYLMCSRRASQSIDINKIKELSKTIISIHDYLMACGYDEKYINEIATKYNLTPESLKACNTLLEDNKDYIRLKSNHSFEDMIDRKIKMNEINFRNYIESFKKDEAMNIVDIGWKGGMQEAIESILGKKTEGYYLGLYNSIYSIENRNGILFTYCPEKGKTTIYSEILRSNTQLYEQLTAAPHGSAVGYVMNEEGNIDILTDWDKNEKDLYYNNICDIQEEMLLIERGIAAWTEEMNYLKEIKACAELVLRSALFANKKRLNFLKQLDSGFIWNFNSQNKGLSYDRKGVKISLDIIYSPERYTRYFSKIQRTFPSTLQFVYYPIAVAIYVHIIMITRIKYMLKIK